ncbi:N-acetylmuramoyl-L-alanine amidase [Candidatus Uhrbacteria bacterium]|nr:N-acetylmuramoyl-L-alanine amidase [Candidatus Uhrbacteria bacterium]
MLKWLLLPGLLVTWLVPATSFAAPACYCYFGEKNDCQSIGVEDSATQTQCELICKGKYADIFKSVQFTDSATKFGASLYIECSKAHEAANPIVTKPATGIVLPKLQVKIPTVTFTPVLQKGGELQIDFLGQYINGTYQYIVGIAAFLAIVLVMVGGVQWVLSAGAPSQLEKAKQRIKNGLTGLVLVMTAAAILEIVNPKLGTLRPLTIPSIEGIALDEAIDHSDAVETESDEPAPVAASGEQVKLPFGPGSRSGLTVVKPPLEKEGDGYIDPPRPCTIPVPSVAESLSGVTIDTKFVGLLDCNISNATKNKKRPPSAVKIVILHLGFPGTNVKGMLNMWFSDYHYGKIAKCKQSKKTGEFNYEGCTKDGQRVVRAPSKRQTPIGSHFAVTTDGKIFQLADVGHIMNHCCKENNISVGIDIFYGMEGKKYTYTEAQYDNIAKLIQGLSKKYGFKIDDSTVRGHCEFSKPPSAHVDPPNFDLKKLGQKMGVTLDPATHTPTGGSKCFWL